MVTSIVDIRRYDLPKDHPFTPGEYGNLTIKVREEQSDGTLPYATDFSSYTNWQFWVLKTGDLKLKTYAEMDAAKIFKCASTGSDGITPATAPDIDVIMSVAKTSLVVVTQSIWYEFWADYGGQPKRLAYGLMPWVN